MSLTLKELHNELKAVEGMLESRNMNEYAKCVHNHLENQEIDPKYSEKDFEEMRSKKNTLDDFNNGKIKGRTIQKPDDNKESNNSEQKNKLIDIESGLILPSEKRFSKMFVKSNEEHDFRSFKDFALAVKYGDTKRLQKRASGMWAGIGSEGGNFVPDEFTEVIIDSMVEESVMLQGCRLFPMTSSTKKIPAYDSSNHSNGVFGGMVSKWVGEGQNNDFQIPKTRLIELKTKNLVTLTSATAQLEEDAPDFENSLLEGLKQCLTFDLDEALLNGTGVGQPLGILKSSALITVAKEAGQASQTILWENISKMQSRLHPSCWNNAVWIMHPSTLPELLIMSIPVGVGGISASQYLSFQGQSYYLLGKPVLFSEKMQQLGTVGDILLVDRSKYAVGIRKEISLDISDQILFKTIEKAYRGWMRVDGIPLYNQPITPKNGTNTLSFAVTLAAR